MSRETAGQDEFCQVVKVRDSNDATAGQNESVEAAKILEASREGIKTDYRF